MDWASNSDQFPFLKRWNRTIGSRAMLLLLLEKARGWRVLKFFKWPAPACFSQNLFEKWLRNKTIGVDTIEINLIQPSSGLSKLFRKDQPKIHHLSLYLDFLMAHSEFYHSIWYSCQILSSTALPSFEFLKTTPMRMMPSKYKDLCGVTAALKYLKRLRESLSQLYEAPVGWLEANNVMLSYPRGLRITKKCQYKGLLRIHTASIELVEVKITKNPHINWHL